MMKKFNFVWLLALGLLFGTTACELEDAEDEAEEGKLASSGISCSIDGETVEFDVGTASYIELTETLNLSGSMATGYPSISIAIVKPTEKDYDLAVATSGATLTYIDSAGTTYTAKATNEDAGGVYVRDLDLEDGGTIEAGFNAEVEDDEGNKITIISGSVDMAISFQSN